MLTPQLGAARVWDACAGSGAVGLEALSRGAEFALFSEPDRAAHRAVTNNALRCGFAAESYQVWRTTWRPLVSSW